MKEWKNTAKGRRDRGLHFKGFALESERHYQRNVTNYLRAGAVQLSKWFLKLFSDLKLFFARQWHFRWDVFVLFVWGTVWDDTVVPEYIWGILKEALWFHPKVVVGGFQMEDKEAELSLHCFCFWRQRKISLWLYFLLFIMWPQFVYTDRCVIIYIMCDFC